MPGSEAGGRIWGRLAEGPTWFVVRAQPGLGRLTEALALMELLRGTGASLRLLTSPEAVPLARRLFSGPVEAFSLAAGPDPQQAVIDSADLHRLLTTLRRARPRALVVHGHPLLLPIFRHASSAALVAMANLHDLRSPGHTPGARLLAAALHSSADLVMVGELRLGSRWERLGATPVLRLPALVRPQVLGLPAEAPLAAVAVLGGGSLGDRRLAESTARIVDRLETAVASGELESCLVFPAAAVDPARHPHLLPGRDPLQYPRRLRAADLVVARAGRSSLAELLALGKRAVVIPAHSDTLRGVEQAANAQRAAALSPAIRVLQVLELDRLRVALDEVARAQPRRWSPGNRQVQEELRAGA